ncbi:hypothetical protein [Microbacterium galbinum]|uniref:hypothetical protein n=1 Tax=Microbacterium galbinum TaxID=2851646 RepID=UPI001FFC8913|nr:hypothetical protein [Microbacterium galbinum]MCK2029993.1 hypothetical protein [Microbacterium galbinum]
MSYDLEVYGKVALSARDLVKVVSADRALKAQVDKRADAVGAVVWKKSGAHFLTIDGPMQVEPEDLPEGWAEGEGATVLYSLSITYDVSEGPEGFSATVDERAVDAAMAFAERLAARIDGDVMDPQTWEPVEVAVEAEVVEPESAKARYLHLEWHRLRDDTKDLAEIYLRTARELFPPGVPSRFGMYEPLQGKFPRDDDSTFDLMYRDDAALTSMIFSCGSIADGRIGDWTNDLWMRVQTLSLTIHLDRLEKIDAVEIVERFFVALAERTGCFFAFAEVNHSSYSFVNALPWMRLELREPWSGLPVDPQWLTWFDPGYAELVAPHLDASRIVQTPRGALHRWTDHPAARDELIEISGDPWIPEDFRGVLDPDERGHCSEAAAIMPESLRYPAPDTPIAKRIAAHYAKVAADKPVYVVEQ